MTRFGPWANRRIAIAAALLIVLSTVATMARTIAAGESAQREVSPAATVGQFLADILIDQNGYQGCRYLTAAEQQRVARRAGSPGSCGAALDDSHLRLGDLNLTTTREVYHDLAVRTRRARGAVVVRVSRAGDAFDLTLVRATPTERTDFDAPPTPWRISGGVAALVPRLRE